MKPSELKPAKELLNNSSLYNLCKDTLTSISKNADELLNHKFTVEYHILSKYSIGSLDELADLFNKKIEVS